MTTWGGLNPALTAWRVAVNRVLPGRSTKSDGARADAAHGAKSQHQADRDGTVDAFDMDVNVLASNKPTGTPDELRIVEALKLDFEEDPHGRGQLWIHNREIANKGIGRFREREYDGKSGHTEHTHWESDPDHEKDGRPWPTPHTERVLAEMRGDLDVDSAELIKDLLATDLGRKGGGDTVGVALQTAMAQSQRAADSAAATAAAVAGLDSKLGDILTVLTEIRNAQRPA